MITPARAYKDTCPRIMIIELQLCTFSICCGLNNMFYLADTWFSHVYEINHIYQCPIYIMHQLVLTSQKHHLELLVIQFQHNIMAMTSDCRVYLHILIGLTHLTLHSAHCAVRSVKCVKPLRSVMFVSQWHHKSDKFSTAHLFICSKLVARVMSLTDKHP